MTLGQQIRERLEQLAGNYDLMLQGHGDLIRAEASEIEKMVDGARLLTCCPQCKLIFDARSNPLSNEGGDASCRVDTSETANASSTHASEGAVKVQTPAAPKCAVCGRTDHRGVTDHYFTADICRYGHPILADNYCEQGHSRPVHTEIHRVKAEDTPA